MPFSKKTIGNFQRAVSLFQKAAPQKRDNLIRRLLNGEYSLTLTFWLFCLSVPLAGDLLFSYLLFPLLDLSRAKDCTALVTWALAIAFYMLIANIGLWRSAAQHPYPPLSILGKAASVLGLLAAAAYVLRWYAIWMLVTG